MRNKGIEVESISAGGPAQRAGLLAGDVILSVSGTPVSDEIDYMYCVSEPEASIEVRRGGDVLNLALKAAEGEGPGLVLKRFKIKTCRNNCVFCFVAQLPRGLRKTLYVKDEDYRMSFLHGNFITMTNLTESDKRRIAEQRLSPLYISVHSTDRKIRNKLLGNATAPDIMKELGFLKKNRIRMHVQIVLCPGYNDGKELAKTIRELYSLYPYLLSAAVVPVGLTEHRRLKLAPVGKEDAERALDIVSGFQKRFRKKHGDAVVYGADELYIKAGRPFPPLRDYGDLPQTENGVGLVPLFLSQAKAVTIEKPGKKKFITFTGMSFYPYLKKFVDRLQKSGVHLEVVPVKNSFFGKSVTVTGLLTGRDVVRALAGKTQGRDVLLMPDVVLREEGSVFLDDLSVKDVENALSINVKVIEPVPEGLIKALTEEDK